MHVLVRGASCEVLDAHCVFRLTARQGGGHKQFAENCMGGLAMSARLFAAKGCLAALLVLASLFPFGDASAQIVVFSPAGCAANAQNSHPSSTPNYYHTVNHKGSLSCNWSVSWTFEVWGERSSWSGWRGHASHKVTNGFGTGEVNNSGANCLDGTYDYKTRVKAWSYEGGYTYSANVHGASQRIKRISAPSYWAGYKCAWA